MRIRLVPAKLLRLRLIRRRPPMPPGTDPAALRVADALAIMPDDPTAAADEIQRRREEIGFSYFVFGAAFADTLAPIVTKLAGH